jgi:hypothetical protein
MRNTLLIIFLSLAIATASALLTSTPSFALCNEICQAKCKLGWQNEFKSQKECVAVWSRRNGPTGRGCGTSGSFQRCE